MDITSNVINHPGITPRMARMGLKVLINGQGSAPTECLTDTHVSTLPMFWNNLTSSQAWSQGTYRSNARPPAGAMKFRLAFYILPRRFRGIKSLTSSPMAHDWFRTCGASPPQLFASTPGGKALVTIRTSGGQLARVGQLLPWGVAILGKMSLF